MDPPYRGSLPGGEYGFEEVPGLFESVRVGEHRCKGQLDSRVIRVLLSKRLKR